MNKTKSPRSGFTLIELLTVIAIIGILAAILIPTVGAVKTKANMITSSSNLRQIAMAYNNFANSSSRTRVISKVSGAKYEASTRAAWGEILAEYGDLNDAALYFISSDKDVAAFDIPGVILTGTTGAYTVNPDWTTLALTNDLISYDMAVDISSNGSASSTPLIWTKGLDNTTGLWSTADSPWLGKGGHIAFADGHVTFYETLVDQLIQGPLATNPGEKASSPVDALGGAAYVLD
jgi:prepilin-type N-terminal cleavage/methylation domain-containing protein/prepilin-type processing-associated H-X9-DG protein